jgi:hypothetical protein
VSSQNFKILSHLRKNTLTGLQALQFFGCMRLASRINELRQAGNVILTTFIKLENGKRIAKYSLKGHK